MLYHLILYYVPMIKPNPSLQDAREAHQEKEKALRQRDAAEEPFGLMIFLSKPWLFPVQKVIFPDSNWSFLVAFLCHPL